ncbi:MAG: lipopolysaccharide biosynthesis protein [Burkholderiaceae bacterium]
MLSPREIGVFSITLVFVNIMHMFRDFGVGSYLQHEPDLTPDKVRAAMGVLFTSSWLIAGFLYFASGFIGQWFSEPGIVPVMRVISIGFLFIPFGSVTHALLTREFAADKQAIVSVITTLSYSAACLGLASLGFGTMSLAWANLVNIVVGGIAYMPFRPKDMPWIPSFRHWRGVVHFGLGSLVANCAAAFNEGIPDLFLGKMSGARSVGLFSRANSTVSIFTYLAGSTVNYGAISYVSKAHHQGEALTPLLNRAVSLLTGIGWPILGVTAILGHELVLALYGPKWLEAVPAIPALTLAAAVAMLFNYTPTALTAIGRPDLTAIPLLMTIVARIGFGLLLFDGTLQSFAWAICIASIAAAPLMIRQHSRHLNYHFRSMVHAVLPSFSVSVSCMTASFLLKRLLPGNMPPVLHLVLLGISITLVWFASLHLARHPLLFELQHIVQRVKGRFIKT